jgi:hypothetical protein
MEGATIIPHSVLRLRGMKTIFKIGQIFSLFSTAAVAPNGLWRVPTGDP